MATRTLASIALDVLSPSVVSTYRDGPGRKLLDRVSTRLVPEMARVNDGRRVARRLERLRPALREQAKVNPEVFGRAVEAWRECLVVLDELVDTLNADAIRDLDRLVARTDDPTLPGSDLVQLTGTVGMGFSASELDWLTRQIGLSDSRPLHLLTGGEPRVLRNLCRASFSGEAGVQQIGFCGLPEEPEARRDVEGAFARAASAGVTVSLFTVMPALVLLAGALDDDPNTGVARATRDVDARHAIFSP